MMRWPFILRKEHDAIVKSLDARITDLERHFVTRRNESGQVVETLADVPVEKRNPLRNLRGMSWPQRRAYLERTDGGRNVGGN